MSTEQAGNQKAGHQAPAGPTTAQTGLEQGMMTSWLRRRFRLDPESRQRPGARKSRFVGVATERIQRLLARVRGTRERARVWNPDIGSLRPELVQRFSGTIARRHERLQLVGVRRRLATPVDQWQDALELTLPRGVSPAETGTGATPGKMRGPSIFSVGQPIPRMGPQAPTASRPSRQSRVPSRPAGQAQHRQPPPRSRLFARVEEVAPAGRKPSTEEEEIPVQQEADLEPQDPDLEVKDTEPSPEGERPSPPGSESAAPRAQPTIQRRAVDARAPTPPRRQQDPSRSRKPPVEQTQTPPLAGELGEPQVPPSETPLSPGEPGPETADRQAADNLPLRPAPGAPSPAPPQEEAAREPSLPRREQRARRQPDAASPRQHMPLHREGEGTPRGPSRAPTPPVEPVQPAWPTAREEEPAERPRPAESDAEPLPVAGREQLQAPPSKPVESTPMTEQVQRQPLAKAPAEDRQPAEPEDRAVVAARQEAEPGPEMVLRRPPAPPEAVDRRAEQPEPVTEVARPRSALTVQRQARETAGRQTAPPLSADGRTILARARSRARATLTKLTPARHRSPEAGPLPTGAPEVLHHAAAAGPGILGRILRQRRHRTDSLTLYGRGPDVRIGPDSSLPVTRRFAGARPHRQSGLEQPRERPAPAIPPEVRSLLSAMEGRAEGSIRDGGLPLPSLPGRSVPPGTSIQRAKTDRASTWFGPPGGSSEPPRLPPPPPEEPSLPLARPPAPRPVEEQKMERTSGTGDVVQRAPDGPVGTLQREPAVVQRVPGEDDPYQEIDLGYLARLVYPVIKRMLSIERERTRGRSL